MTQNIRTFSLAAVAAGLLTLSSSASLAQSSEPTEPQSEVTMLTGKVYQALSECSIDTGAIAQLTMAQVAGIVLASSGGEESETCMRVRALVE